MLDRLKEFYRSLDDLERQVGGKRLLRNCNRWMDWPSRGVCFFFENGEKRSGSGVGLRVAHVSTHAIIRTSQVMLWDRLRQHKSGGSRQSVFCSLVERALESRDGKAPTKIEVSDYICDMPFLWVAVDDEPSPDSDRVFVKRHAIGLLSAPDSIKADPPSASWLGHHTRDERISRSGLWNRDNVFDQPDPGFLETLRKHIDSTPSL